MRDGDRITIVFLIDFLATREGVTGGTERQLIELIGALDRTRFRPILFCLQEHAGPPQWDRLACEKHVLHVYSLASWKGIKSFFSFISFLRENSVDIVQSYFHDSTMFGIPAARIAGVRKTVSCRRDMGFWYDEKALKRLSLVNRFTHRILVNSQAVKSIVSSLEGVHPARIDVILNGIDMQTFSREKRADLSSEYPDIKPGDRVVGMVANINREVKRGDLFARAAALVARDRPGVKFLIIGSGRLEKDLRGLIHELGIDEVLILGGRKDSAAAYIKGFDVGVLTSDSEGFSNVILEYMAAGIPVVATDVGGNREIVRHGESGMLVPPGDHEALARAISGLLDDGEERIEMGLRAQRQVNASFAWEHRAREMGLYYQNLMDGI